ncbi:unnamed protein product, partial [Phaeothamnion confervicola]
MRDDPIERLFRIACDDHTSQEPVITSQRQWRAFSSSLASEGLVTARDEQLKLQRLWDTALSGSSAAFGGGPDPGGPRLSHRDVQRRIEDMYLPAAAKDVDDAASRLGACVTGLGGLIDTWRLASLDMVQTRRLLEVLAELENERAAAAALLAAEAARRDVLFNTACVRRFLSTDKTPFETAGGGGIRGTAAGTTGDSATAGAHDCDNGTYGGGGDNPLLWQNQNAVVVERAAARRRVRPPLLLGRSVAADPW